MMSEIMKFVKKIGNSKLRQNVREILREPDIKLDVERVPLEVCPAGAYVHHAYRGGLLQHTVAVVRIALTMCDLVEEVYGGEINRDVVTAGAILHDVMKCYVYSPTNHGSFTSSTLGDRIDHLTLLVAEMYRRDFPLDVIHVVAAHHDDQSPIKPKTVEALIVSIADYTDSELSRRVLRAAEYLLRQATGGEARCTSSKEALQVLSAKTREGLEGVRRLSQGK